MSEHFRCANINQPEHNTVRLIDFRTKLEPNKYYAFYLHTPPKLEVKNKEDKIEQKNNFSFDVFLSHNNQDKPIVRELAQELLSYNLRVWLDEEQLLPGRSWHEGLNQDFQKFGAAAVLIGPNGLGPWQAKEIEACISESVARKLPVIPVFLPGAPDNPNLPIFLGHLTYVDLRNGLTKAGLEKLIWGITGSKHVHVKSLEVCSHPIGSYFEEIGYTFEKPLFDDLENWTPKGDKFILLTATKEEINHFPNIIFSVSGKLRNSLAEDKFVGSFARQS